MAGNVMLRLLVITLLTLFLIIFAFNLNIHLKRKSAKQPVELSAKDLLLFDEFKSKFDNDILPLKRIANKYNDGGVVSRRFECNGILRRSSENFYIYGVDSYSLYAVDSTYEKYINAFKDKNMFADEMYFLDDGLANIHLKVVPVQDLEYHFHSLIYRRYEDIELDFAHETFIDSILNENWKYVYYVSNDW